MDLSELLECSICLEQLSHRNKVLPCQHTFCTQCLKDVYNKRQMLDCPECRKKVTDPIDSLPPNILANRILESMGQQQQSPRPVTPTPVKNVSGPTLPLPRRPPSIVKTPVITPPVINAPVIKPPVISPPLLSPVQAATPSIPGNHQTNPFLDLIDASSYYDQQMELCSKMSKSQIHHTTSSAVAPPRPPSSLTPSSSLISSSTNQRPVSMSRDLSGPIREQISSSGPPLPDRNKVQSRQDNVVSDSTKEWQLSPRAILDPPRSSPSMSSITPTSPSQMFRAVFEYAAVQKDELSLRRGELYTVTERCHDGWCKGQSVKTGQIGVFPGNYVKEYDGKQAKKGKSRREAQQVTEGPLIDLSAAQPMRGQYSGHVTSVDQSEGAQPETDAERLAKLKAIRETLRQAQHQMSAKPGQRGAAAQTKSKGESYRCIVPFPASSEYEVSLQLGDVVTLVKRREDGWCKGTHHRTGKTGLFPASFVDKI